MTKTKNKSVSHGKPANNTTSQSGVNRFTEGQPVALTQTVDRGRAKSCAMLFGHLVYKIYQDGSFVVKESPVDRVVGRFDGKSGQEIGYPDGDESLDSPCGIGVPLA